MINRRPIVLFLCALVLGAHSVFAQTVVTWNLEWYPGRQPENPDPEVARAQIATAKAALRLMNPDVFVGLELRDGEVFQDLVSAVPGLKVAVVTSFRGNDGTLDRQRIGIASKLPVHAAWSELWRGTMAALPRGFAFAALRDPSSGKLLMVYGVHLKSNRGADDRTETLNYTLRNESAAQLLTHVAELSRLTFPPGQVRGWLIAGDYNTNDDGQFGDRVIRILESGGFLDTWKGAAKENRQTWRGNESFSPTTFDYIMTRGLGDLRATMADPPIETSDHRPVILKLRAVPAAPRAAAPPRV